MATVVELVLSYKGRDVMRKDSPLCIKSSPRGTKALPQIADSDLEVDEIWIGVQNWNCIIAVSPSCKLSILEFRLSRRLAKSYTCMRKAMRQDPKFTWKVHVWGLKLKSQALEEAASIISGIGFVP